MCSGWRGALTPPYPPLTPPLPRPPTPPSTPFQAQASPFSFSEAEEGEPGIGAAPAGGGVRVNHPPDVNSGGAGIGATFDATLDDAEFDALFDG